jgi:hypothetical protein
MRYPEPLEDVALLRLYILFYQMSIRHLHKLIMRYPEPLEDVALLRLYILFYPLPILSSKALRACSRSSKWIFSVPRI